MNDLNQIICLIRELKVPYRVVAENSRGVISPDDKGVSHNLISRIMSGRHKNLTIMSEQKILGALEKIQRRMGASNPEQNKH